MIWDANKDLPVAYDLRLLPASDTLLREIEEAVSRDRLWEQFVELRMAAGPTLRIETLSPSGGFRVQVEWGSQLAASVVGSIPDAIEVADRLGWTFYEIRKDGPKQLD